MIKKKYLSRFGASAQPPEPEPSKTERPAVKAPKEPGHDPHDIARANERQSDFNWGWQDRLAGKPMTSAHSPAYCRGYLAAHRSTKEQSRVDNARGPAASMPRSRSIPIVRRHRLATSRSRS